MHESPIGGAHGATLRNNEYGWKPEHFHRALDEGDQYAFLRGKRVGKTSISGALWFVAYFSEEKNSG